MQGIHSHPGDGHQRLGVTMLNFYDSKFCTGAGSKVFVLI